MKITINDKYFIEKDMYNFTLKECTGNYDKNFKPIEKVHGYFNSVESALKRYIQNKMEEENNETVTLSEYVELIKKYNNELIEVIRGVKRNE